MRIINKLKNKYHTSKIKQYGSIEGFLQHEEALTLYDLAKSLKPNSKVIEIGSWKGKSTFCIAKGLKNGNIYAIDPFNADGDTDAKKTYDKTIGDKSLLEQFIYNMESRRVLKKIKICKGYSSDFVEQIEAAEMLFIDGDHSISGCEYDFLNYHPKLVGAKIIAIHDYYPERPELGPTYVINKYILSEPNIWQVIKTVDSLFVAKKK